MKTVLALLLLTLSVHAEPINEEFDLTATTIIVNWFDSELELQDALDDAEIAGLAECEYRPEFNISFCEFWLVQPTELDEWTEDFEQDKWKSIGHEFYHAVKGAFHNESQGAE